MKVNETWVRFKHKELNHVGGIAFAIAEKAGDKFKEVKKIFNVSKLV